MFATLSNVICIIYWIEKLRPNGVIENIFVRVSEETKVFYLDNDVMC